MGKKITFFFLLLIVFSACRKKINVPDDSLQNLFGTWNWLYTFEPNGGYNTPTIMGTSITRVYTDKGRFEYKKGKSTEQKMNFDFTTSSSSTYKYATEFTQRTFSQATRSTENIHFLGNDTLVITLTCDTCYKEVYIKAK